MNFVGIDLHKKTIVLCVMDQGLNILARRTFACGGTDPILAYFRELGPFRAVVEATASYEWLVELLEPLAEAILLAHPGKLRVIAESHKKTDRLDAQVLAEYLARGMIPEAFRPDARQREHRALVRHRRRLKQATTAVKNRIRRIAADYNADRKDLFTAAGRKHLGGLKLRDADRFVLDQLDAHRLFLEGQLKDLTARLRAFAAAAPSKEAEARAKLATIPGVGPVTVDVVVSELGDVSRFKSTKAVCAYVGLVPAVRQSDGRRKDLPITKKGSPLMRWALVEAAWRAVRLNAAWRPIFEGIRKRAGARRAIVAVARRLLTVMAAMLRDGTNFDLLKVGEMPRRPRPQPA